ncbi:hypothetical protein FACS189430_05670 [Bacteroidia bacterium]|nr:hypothetical protein FACS189430_05670 [Bacteroidia bacterium]
MATSTVKKTVKTKPMAAETPKRLSKAGEWLKNNPNGIFTIVDMKAVMK